MASGAATAAKSGAKSAIAGPNPASRPTDLPTNSTKGKNQQNALSGQRRDEGSGKSAGDAVGLRAHGEGMVLGQGEESQGRRSEEDKLMNEEPEHKCEENGFINSGQQPAQHPEASGMTLKAPCLPNKEEIIEM